MRTRLRKLVTAVSTRVTRAAAKRRLIGPLLAALLIAGLALTHAQGQESPESLAAQLQARGQGRLAYHPRTGLVRFYSAGRDSTAQALQPGQGSTAMPEDPPAVALSFLNTYGPLFGVRSPADELTVTRLAEADRGRSFLRYQQLYQGVPVMGGELVLQVAGGTVLSANGEIAPLDRLSPEPTLTATEARGRALALAAKDSGLTPEQLRTTQPELWVYDPRLLTPYDTPPSLVWRLEVASGEAPWLHQLVLVDAHVGAVELRLDLVQTALDRAVYDNDNEVAFGLPGQGPVRTEGQDSTGIADVDRAYDYLGDAYHFYLDLHGRDGYDGKGAQNVATVRYCHPGESCPYGNAFWSGYYQQFAFGDGMVADDVVAHEYTHAVTEHTSGLFYLYQSGAINEALSDIWGEFVDLTNGRGDDRSTVRWLVGEEILGGPWRSMEDPPAYYQPDRMTSPYYRCDPQFLDNGGVHSNSGVLNKAAFLIADGGTFNGWTMSGIGLEKTARVFYELQTNLLTTGSEYPDVYSLLPQACLNLTGTGGITPTDCQQVEAAVQSTEMDQEPVACARAEASICPAGKVCTELFYDGFEAGPSPSWGARLLSGDSAATHAWSTSDQYAADGTNALWNPAQPVWGDTVAYLTDCVSLPSGRGSYLHFRHSYNFERVIVYSTPYFADGGVLEYSTDEGVSWHDAASLFEVNGYTDAIAPVYRDYSPSDNPLRGRDAFVGSSHGWLSTRLDLSPLAGECVCLRFRVGTDTGTGYPDYRGWFIDDVRLYTCDIPTATPTVTVTPSPTVTPTATPTTKPTATPKPTVTPTTEPTATPTPSFNYLPFVPR